MEGKNPLAAVSQFQLEEQELSYLTMEQIEVSLPSSAFRKSQQRDALTDFSYVFLRCQVERGRGTEAHSGAGWAGSLLGTKSGKNDSVPISEELMAELGPGVENDPHRPPVRLLVLCVREGVERARLTVTKRAAHACPCGILSPATS